MFWFARGNIWMLRTVSALYITSVSSPLRETEARLYLDGRASFTARGIDLNYRLDCLCQALH